MALHHRRFLLPDPKKRPDKKLEDDKPKKNDPDCHLDHCNQQHLSSPSQPRYHFPYLILTVCFIAASFLLFLAYCVFRRYRSRRYSTNPPPSDGLLIDNDLQQSPDNVIDHHVWHIRTIGLSEAAIDSIAVFKYKKRDGLIEGKSDCSVCLSEFLEDESLRILPKCSHAFHVACIDTWLRCHKNCPVCRAPVVPGDRDGVSEGNLVVSGSSGVRSGEENQVESEIGMGETENDSSVRNGKFRVVSDLGDHHDRVNVSQELRGQVRRAVSMDLSRLR